MFDFSFDWRPDFESGIEILDTQHKKLFRICRDMEQMLRVNCMGVTDKQLLDLVCELREFAGYHFYEEEKMMDLCEYPDSDSKSHKEQHAAFLQRIMQINIPELKQSPEKVLRAVQIELQNSVPIHILKEDLKLSAYVIKNHVKTGTPQGEIVKPADECEQIFGRKIGELDVTRIYLYEEQSHKGRVAVVFKEMSREISRLSALERNLFFADIAQVAKAIQKLYSPQTFEYSSHGDMDSHLHVHIIPKYRDEFEWGEVCSLNPGRVFLTEEEYQKMLDEIRQELKMR